jgi:hypothetical protein
VVFSRRARGDLGGREPSAARIPISLARCAVAECAREPDGGDEHSPGGEDGKQGHRALSGEGLVEGAEEGTEKGCGQLGCGAGEDLADGAREGAIGPSTRGMRLDMARFSVFCERETYAHGAAQYLKAECELMRVGHGKRAEEEAVDDGKDGAAGADP